MDCCSLCWRFPVDIRVWVSCLRVSAVEFFSSSWLLWVPSWLHLGDDQRKSWKRSETSLLHSYSEKRKQAEWWKKRNEDSILCFLFIEASLSLDFLRLLRNSSILRHPWSHHKKYLRIILRYYIALTYRRLKASIILPCELCESILHLVLEDGTVLSADTHARNTSTNPFS